MNNKYIYTHIKLSILDKIKILPKLYDSPCKGPQLKMTEIKKEKKNQR